nr:non-specific lipid-transfer protein-like protein At2g13820 [Tanacetum cinerariifolium]
MNTIVMILVMITLATRYGSVTAQSSGCTSVLVIMSPCLSYIAGNVSTVSSGCCTQLASVIQLMPQCLCQLFNGTGVFMGINLNRIQASELSKVCNVQTPSECNGNVQTPAPPSNSPADTPPSTTVPPANTRPSDATSIRFTSIPVLFLLHVAAYAMVF